MTTVDSVMLWGLGSAIGIHIVNTFIGTYMAFLKKNAVLVRVHVVLYVCLLVCLTCYLVGRGLKSQISLADGLVGLYFVTLLPKSAKWDPLLHALVATIALVMLPLLLLFSS